MLTGMLRVAGAMAVLAVIVASMTPLPNIAARLLAEQQPLSGVGAIVVLGSDVRSDGTLGNGSLRRTMTGLEQLRSGVAPLILFLGYSSANGVSEATVRAQLARRLGVSEAAILTDASGKTTGEEAAVAWRLLQPRGIQTVLIVTDSRHTRRARRVFEQAGFTVGTLGADEISSETVEPEERLRLSRHVAQQALAQLVYSLRN